MSEQGAAPIGTNGPNTAPSVCKCGATERNAAGTRCLRGHVLIANAESMLVGHRADSFWREAEAARAEIRDTAIADAGHEPEDAPKALTVAADGLAQAVLIRDAAFARVVQSGGPLTSKDRSRRAFAVWESSAASVERHVRVLGLRRVPRTVASFADAVRAAGERSE